MYSNTFCEGFIDAPIYGRVIPARLGVARGGGGVLLGVGPPVCRVGAVPVAGGGVMFVAEEEGKEDEPEDHPPELTVWPFDKEGGPPNPWALDEGDEGSRYIVKFTEESVYYAFGTLEKGRYVYYFRWRGDPSSGKWVKVAERFDPRCALHRAVLEKSAHHNRC